VAGDVGNHTINVAVLADGAQLFETQPQTFTIVERPVPPKKFKFTRTHALIFVIALIIILAIYIKKQSIKERLWHREFRRSIRKRD
jgi:hypothetical protein